MSSWSSGSLGVLASWALGCAGPSVEADRARFADGDASLIVGVSRNQVRLFDAATLKLLWSRDYPVAEHGGIEAWAEKGGRFVLVGERDAKTWLKVTDRESGRDVVALTFVEPMRLHGARLARDQLLVVELQPKPAGASQVEQVLQRFSLATGEHLPNDGPTTAQELFVRAGRFGGGGMFYITLPDGRSSGPEDPPKWVNDQMRGEHYLRPIHLSGDCAHVVRADDGAVFELHPGRENVELLGVGKRVAWAHNLFQDGASADWTREAVFADDGSALLYFVGDGRFRVRSIPPCQR